MPFRLASWELNQLVVLLWSVISQWCWTCWLVVGRLLHLTASTVFHQSRRTRDYWTIWCCFWVAVPSPYFWGCQLALACMIASSLRSTEVHESVEVGLMAALIVCLYFSCLEPFAACSTGRKALHCRQLVLLSNHGRYHPSLTSVFLAISRRRDDLQASSPWLPPALLTSRFLLALRWPLHCLLRHHHHLACLPSPNTRSQLCLRWRVVGSCYFP